MDGDLRVPVTTKEELLDHLDRGWKLYFHKSVRRWYVYRGARHRKIVSATLENLCEQLHSELSGERQPVPALEVQERRWQGQPIEGIASDVGLSRGAVYNALEKNPDDIVKPRERLQRVTTRETAPEISREADSHEEEKLDGNPLNSLIVAGILVGVPLGILSLWFLGNLAAGKLKT
jgi:hypothetical protein